MTDGNKELSDLSGRVQAIEDYLFPPGGPTDPGLRAGGLQQQLDELRTRLDQLEQKLEKYEEDGLPGIYNRIKQIELALQRALPGHQQGRA